MAIMVDPDGMREVIFNVICKLKEKVIRNKAEFKRIEQSLETEFWKSSELYNEFIEVNNKLETIIAHLSNCERFIDNAILEYLNANKKVDMFFQRVIGKELVARKNIFKETFSVQGNRKDAIALSLINYIEEKPSKLPPKDTFFKADVNVGKIDNGNNILVRAWKIV
ncbi:MAG: hypothetical protein GX194_06470 [Clostridium sp.]|nr:hypothetical protein [Clostridium sp.]